MVVVARLAVVAACVVAGCAGNDDGEPVTGEPRSICEPQPDEDARASLMIAVAPSTDPGVPGVAAVECTVSEASFEAGRVDASGLPADSRITLSCAASGTYVVRIGGEAAPDPSWMLDLDVVLDDLRYCCSGDGGAHSAAWFRLTTAEGEPLLVTTSGDALLPYPWLAGSDPGLLDAYPWFEVASPPYWYGLDVDVAWDACPREPDPFHEVCGADIFLRRAAIDFSDGGSQTRIHDGNLGSVGPWLIGVSARTTEVGDPGLGHECVEYTDVPGLGLAMVRTEAPG